MDVVLTNRKVRKQRLNEEENASRLTSLPDNVLHLILSCLPTKYAVRTSILSKRWQNLWMSIYKLDFDDWDYVDYYKFDGEDDGSRALFTNFVERVLVLRDPSDIREFRLSCEVMLDASRINSWVSAAVTHNVEELNIKLQRFQEPFVLPHCLFCSESLKVLEVSMMHDLKLPLTICLSNLKILNLTYVKFPDDPATQELFSNCPLLEDLKLHDCNWENVKIVCIPGPRLKSVFISDHTIDQSGYASHSGDEAGDQDGDRGYGRDRGYSDDQYIDHRYVGDRGYSDYQYSDHEYGDDCGYGDDQDEGSGPDDQENNAQYGRNRNSNRIHDHDKVKKKKLNDCQVMIIGKNLQHLNYMGDLINDFCLYNSPPLVSASFYVRRRCREAAFRGLKLLHQLSFAKSLTIQAETFAVLSCAEVFCSYVPLFHNLKHLLTIRESADFASEALLNILQNSPNLSHLEFESGISLSAYSEQENWQLDPLPPCFLTHLKLIEIRYFRGTEEELQVIKVLLKTSTVLEKMRFDFSSGVKNQRKIYDQLLGLPRGSMTCKIELI